MFKQEPLVPLGSQRRTLFLRPQYPTEGVRISDSNKYISEALNPSVSNLHEAQSVVHVQFKKKKKAKKETSDIKNIPEVGG